MYEYMTRHMVALREFNYGDSTVKEGEPFLATPDDVGYLKLAGKAREGAPVVQTTTRRVDISTIADREPVVIDAPLVRDEDQFASPGEAEVAPIEAEVATDDEAKTDAADDAEEVVPVTRRRGRQRESA